MESGLKWDLKILKSSQKDENRMLTQEVLEKKTQRKSGLGLQEAVG